MACLPRLVLCAIDALRTSLILMLPIGVDLCLVRWEYPGAITWTVCVRGTIALGLRLTNPWMTLLLDELLEQPKGNTTLDFTTRLAIDVFRGATAKVHCRRVPALPTPFFPFPSSGFVGFLPPSSRAQQ